MTKKILVGISGGIDSTATVLMLKEKGFEVEAIYVDMLDCEISRNNVRELCTKLNIKLHIAPCATLFSQEVVEKVIAEHLAARTPSPCTLCNPFVKWKTIKEYADKLNIFYIASGHYINIVQLNSWYYIEKGIDTIKDQSYYLYSLGQDILSRAVTPLGKYTKKEVREYLLQKGFPEMSTMGESQGVCFAKRGYRDFLNEHTNPKPGKVLDCNGTEIGQHSGYALYTIGQKRGFTLYNEETKAEIRSINAQQNTITVGTPLYNNELMLENAWFHPTENENITINIRGLGINPTGTAVIENLGDGNIKVTLPSDKFWAITPGQPAVIYQENRVVGGGVAK